MQAEQWLACLKDEAALYGVSFIPKRKHWSFFLWFLLDKLFKLFKHPGILDHYYTVIGKTVFCPGEDSFEDLTLLSQASILNHELQHIRDNYGVLNKNNFFKRALWGLRYLLSRSFRAKIELRGYIRNLEARVVFDSPLDTDIFNLIYLQLTTVNYFLFVPTGLAYSWLYSLQKWVTENCSADSPLPILLPPIEEPLVAQW